MNDGEQDIGIQSKVSLLDQHSELKKKAEGIYWLINEEDSFLHVSCENIQCKLLVENMGVAEDRKIDTRS